MEREVSAVLSPLGIEDSLSRRVAGALLSVEASLPPPAAPPSVFRQALNVVARRPRFTDLAPSSSDPERARLLPEAARKAADEDEDEKGLTAFLLKFGEGLEETTDARLFVSAATIGLSYLLGGLVPLLVRLPLFLHDLTTNFFLANLYFGSPISSFPSPVTLSGFRSPSRASSSSSSESSRRSSLELRSDGPGASFPNVLPSFVD